jgi:phosphatidylinositol alpha-mannosyltransferase
MAGLGEQVQVLAPRARGAPRRQVVDGVPVVTAGPALGLPTNGSTARLALDPVSRRRSTRWALAGLDVVHVHEPIPPGIGHSVLRRLAADRDLGLPGPAVLATVHVAMSSRPAGRSRSLRSAAGHVGGLLRGVDVLSAVSEHARRTLVDHLGRVPLVVPNGVDVASWSPPAARAVPPHDGGTVVVVGRDEPRKGVDVLLRAWPRVRAARPGTRLLVVGPVGGLRAAAGHGVHLLGAVDEAAKRDLVAGADVLVAPHRGGESFGLVLVEALAAGTPVVASDLPAFRAVLAGHGRLVAPGDPAALAAAVLAELDEAAGADPDRAAARRRRAEEFDTPVVAARWRELYDTALRVRAGGAALSEELDGRCGTGRRRLGGWRARAPASTPGRPPWAGRGPPPPTRPTRRPRAG